MGYLKPSLFVAVLATATFGASAQVSSGTGFSVAPQILVTNEHVIADCVSIEVIAADGRRKAAVLDMDVQNDLALLRVVGLRGPTARLRNPRNVRLGEPVMVFGFPLAGSLSSGGNFTSGLVSALRGLRDAAGELQITSPVQPGNSGGPLLDSGGLVIGVVQAKLDALRSAIATGDIPQNVNFAISLEVLADFLVKNNVAFRESPLSATLDTARIAALAQTFTYRIECHGKSRQLKSSSGVNPPVAQPSTRLPKDCDVCPEMVVISAGTFTMGSRETGAQWLDSRPLRPVTIARDFSIGKYEVTFDEWDACTREGGCGHADDRGWGRGRMPVISISWDDANQYVQWLARKTKKSYRLLTEAEWEFSARAGTNTKYSFGESISPSMANYREPGVVLVEQEVQTAKVGSYPANGFGLHEMHGNVWEWTQDCWLAGYSGAPTDGRARESGACTHRVLRGGAWSSTSENLASAVRSFDKSSSRHAAYGLRVARTD